MSSYHLSTKRLKILEVSPGNDNLSSSGDKNRMTLLNTDTPKSAIIKQDIRTSMLETEDVLSSHPLQIDAILL